MYYAIYGIDVEDSLALRKQVRDAHLKRLQILYNEGRLLVAGPLPKEDHAADRGFQGSIIIADFANIEDAKAWAAADPYITAGVYQNVKVMPFMKVYPL